MRKEKERDKLVIKIADAFNERNRRSLTQTTNHCIDEMMVQIQSDVENIIGDYEKEHIIKELLKLHKENPENPPLDILEWIANILLSKKNWLVFHDKRVELDK